MHGSRNFPSSGGGQEIILFAGRWGRVGPFFFLYIYEMNLIILFFGKGGGGLEPHPRFPSRSAHEWVVNNNEYKINKSSKFLPFFKS